MLMGFIMVYKPTHIIGGHHPVVSPTFSSWGSPEMDFSNNWVQLRYVFSISKNLAVPSKIISSNIIQYRYDPMSSNVIQCHPISINIHNLWISLISSNIHNLWILHMNPLNHLKAVSWLPCPSHAQHFWKRSPRTAVTIRRPWPGPSILMVVIMIIMLMIIIIIVIKCVIITIGLSFLGYIYIYT